MPLVSSPRLSARGPAATRTSAAQGAGYKNVPEMHLVAIFCEKKSETVTKHKVNQSKIVLFRLAIPWRFFGTRGGIFGFGGGAFSASEFC